MRLAERGSLQNELEKRENIKFFGQVEHSELMKMMERTKAIILPSQIYEGFPMIIMKAFSMHRSVIVGDIGNNAALIRDGVNGMKFKYDSVVELLKLLTYLKWSTGIEWGRKHMMII